MTLFNFGAIRCASGNAIHILPKVIEFGTVGIYIWECIYIMRMSTDEVSIADPNSESRQEQYRLSILKPL